MVTPSSQLDPSRRQIQVLLLLFFLFISVICLFIYITCNFVVFKQLRYQPRSAVINKQPFV